MAEKKAAEDAEERRQEAERKKEEEARLSVEIKFRASHAVDATCFRSCVCAMAWRLTNVSQLCSDNLPHCLISAQASTRSLTPPAASASRPSTSPNSPWDGVVENGLRSRMNIEGIW